MKKFLIGMVAALLLCSVASAQDDRTPYWQVFVDNNWDDAANGTDWLTASMSRRWVVTTPKPDYHIVKNIGGVNATEFGDSPGPYDDNDRTSIAGTPAPTILFRSSLSTWSSSNNVLGLNRANDTLGTPPHYTLTFGAYDGASETADGKVAIYVPQSGTTGYTTDAVNIVSHQCLKSTVDGEDGLELYMQYSAHCVDEAGTTAALGTDFEVFAYDEHDTAIGDWSFGGLLTVPEEHTHLRTWQFWLECDDSNNNNGLYSQYYMSDIDRLEVYLDGQRAGGDKITDDVEIQF